MYELPAVCRFCTKKSDLIYNLDDENSNLIGKLATLAPDTIEFNAYLPKKICQNCYDKLNETYRFQQQIYHVFKIYKTFMEYQQTPPIIEGEDTSTEQFEYVNENYVSEDLRRFFSNMGTSSTPTTPTFTTPTPTTPIPTSPIQTSPIPTSPIPTTPISTTPIPTTPIPTTPTTPTIANINETFIISDVKSEMKKPAARKPESAAIKRKRGRPRKYSGLMEFKNDDLTDVEKMKDIVVNSLPNIDPDYEPEHYFERPLVINLRKKRGRPKSLAKLEKENNARSDESLMITEQQVHQVYDVPNEPGCSNQESTTPKGSSETPYWRKAI